MPHTSGAQSWFNPASAQTPKGKRGAESDNQSIGGDWGKGITPDKKILVSSESDRVNIRLPARLGTYQIFANVCNRPGKAATVNLPVRVE